MATGTIKRNGMSYSTSGEILTGNYWIDGKPIYTKIVTVDSLPNNTTKNFAVGVSNIETVIRIYGVVTNNNDLDMILPHVSTTLAYIIGLHFDRTNKNIVVTTGSDRRYYSGYLFIEYTKSN